MLKKLFKNREDSDAFLLIKTGSLMIGEAEEMGKKRIFKPSEYEINEFVHKCIKFKKELLRVIDESKHLIDDTIISSELINNVESLEILSLNDCKRLGEYSIKIGRLLRECLISKKELWS